MEHHSIIQRRVNERPIKKLSPKKLDQQTEKMLGEEVLGMEHYALFLAIS
jgi:hypothetical protein